MKNKITILIFLVILTTIFVSSFSTSKYASETTSSVDVAKVALFVVNASSTDNSIDIDCNETDTATYTLQVTNKDTNGNVSEVAITYDIVISFEEALPEGVEIIVSDKNSNTVEYTVSEDKLTYTFNNVGQFLPGEEEVQELKIKFVVDTDNMEDFKEKNVSINVCSKQIN